MDVKHVFIDWQEVDASYGVCGEGYKPQHGSPYGIKIIPHKPFLIEKEEIVKPDKPWDICRAGCANVVKIGNLYHMWYQAINKTPEWICWCYAYSEDGINWIKPDLGIIEFDGNKHNNIVKMDGKPGQPWVDEGEVVLYDEETKNEDERFKMLSTRIYYEGSKQIDIGIISFVSKDGLHWNYLGKAFYAGDCMGTLIYDKDKKKYIATSKAQYSDRLPRRTIVFSESDDFRVWTKPRIVIDGDLNQEPDCDYYNTGFVKWPGAKDAYVLFPSQFHRTGNNVDVKMFVSRDLYTFTTPNNFTAITNEEGCGLSLYQSPDVVVEGNNYIHYLTVFEGGHNGASFGVAGTRRVFYREDGYTSLHCEGDGGFTSIPFNIGTGGLLINADIAKDGFIKVAVTEDYSNDPYEGFSIEDMSIEKVDDIHYLIKWKGDFASLPEKTKVRLNFTLKKCDIYSFTCLNVVPFEGEDGVCPYIVGGLTPEDK